MRELEPQNNFRLHRLRQQWLSKICRLTARHASILRRLQQERKAQTRLSVR